MRSLTNDTVRSMRLLVDLHPSARIARHARRAIAAQDHARKLARRAKRAVGDERIFDKVRAGAAAQSAEALAHAIVRPTMHQLRTEIAMPVVETEGERRYEIDQIIASARLEGAEPSAAMLSLMDRFAIGEITRPEFVRQASELIANTDYAATSSGQAGEGGPTAS